MMEFVKQYQNATLSKYEIVLKMRIKDKYNYVWERNYILARYSNAVEIIFGNEYSNSPFFDEESTEEFFVLKTFIDFIKELKENESLNDFINTDSYRIPKYVFFDILEISEDFKFYLKENLKNEMEGYSILDFSENEVQRINDFYISLGGEIVLLK